MQQNDLTLIIVMRFSAVELYFSNNVKEKKVDKEMKHSLLSYNIKFSLLQCFTVCSGLNLQCYSSH